MAPPPAALKSRVDGKAVAQGKRCSGRHQAPEWVVYIQFRSLISSISALSAAVFFSLNNQSPLRFLFYFQPHWISHITSTFLSEQNEGQTPGFPSLILPEIKMRTTVGLGDPSWPCVTCIQTLQDQCPAGLRSDSGR